jgi:uncharacterized membrane protein YqjE
MDAPEPPGRAARPPRAVRGLFALVLNMLRARLDLATVEVEMHLRTLLRVVLWAVGAMACAMLALALGATALVVALWNGHRMLALLGGSLGFVALTLIFSWLGIRVLRTQPELLEGSLAQLKQDQRRAGSVQ